MIDGTRNVEDGRSADRLTLKNMLSGTFLWVAIRDGGNLVSQQMERVS